MSTKGRVTMDHERVHFNLAKLKKAGQHFEIAIDPDLAIAFKNGKKIDVEDIVKSEKIFSDVKKGLRSSEQELMKVFSTDDFMTIAKQILHEGEIQLTTEYRDKLREEKHKKVVMLISRNAMDPKTKLPHPALRIENAIEEAKVKIDEYKTAEEQVEDVVKKLRTVLPISMQMKKIWVKVPSNHAAKAYKLIVPFAKPSNEKWNNDGSYECHIDLPAGLEADFYEKLNGSTQGSSQTRVVD